MKNGEPQSRQVGRAVWRSLGKEICMTEQEKVYKDFEAKLPAHLKAMDKAGKANFNDWLTCQQALLQMRQTQALEGIHDILRHWAKNGVYQTQALEGVHDILRHWAKNGVYMGPFFG